MGIKDNKMEERKPNILEYMIVIVMVFIATVAMLFGKKLDLLPNNDINDKND